MRFLNNESFEINRTLEEFHQKDQALLVKKKGWVHVQIHDNTFAFHRKTTIEMINGKIEERQKYYLKFKGEATPVDSFGDVLNALTDWLIAIKKKNN